MPRDGNEHPETAMGAAFAKANLVTPPPAERLMHVAVDAWGKHPADTAARRQYVTDALCIEMTYSLIDGWDRSVLGQAIGKLLNDAEKAIKAQRPKQDTAKAVGGGQAHHDTQKVVAPAASFRKPDTGAEPVGGGHERHDTHQACAPATPFRDHARPQAERGSEPASTAPTPIATPPARSNLTILADKQAQLKILADKQQARSLASVAIRLSRLDTVLVAGKPIGDCTVAEVRAWAGDRKKSMLEAGRDMRFALSLVSTLPSGAIIRDYYKNGAEVDAIYARAEAEHAA